jgi:DNA-binding protein H-NS
MKNMNVDAMSVEELLALRENIHKALSTKVSVERRELEAQLARLQEVASEHGDFGSLGRIHPLKGAKIPPKYRGPGGETWAGRGAKPKWLSALLRVGHKLEEFSVDQAGPVRKRSAAKKTRRK